MKVKNTNGCVTQYKLHLNNLTLARDMLIKQQKATNSPSVWAQLDEDIQDLNKRLGELECQMDKISDNSQETWTETK